MPLSWCTEEEFVEYFYEPEDEWHCIHEVLDGFLFQGNVTASMSEKVYRHHNLSGIVNVTSSMARPAHVEDPEQHYLQIEVLDCDSHASSLAERLDEACEFIGTYLLCYSQLLWPALHFGLYHGVGSILRLTFEAAHKERDERVLVHCAAGVSRSSTVSLSYLVAKEGMSLREAWFLLSSKRKIAEPNSGFWEALINFEKEKRGEATVTMQKGEYGWLEPDVYFQTPDQGTADAGPCD